MFQSVPPYVDTRSIEKLTPKIPMIWNGESNRSVLIKQADHEKNKDCSMELRDPGLLAFVHIEKTAGITMSWILRRSFGTRHCDVHPWDRSAGFFSAQDLRRIQKLYPKIRSLSGHEVKPYSDLDKFCPYIRYHTLLREPLTRCASHYQHQIQKMGKRLSFEEWISIERYRNWQTKKLAGTDDPNTAIQMLKSKFIFVGLSERFDESLVLFRKRAATFRLKIFYDSRNVATDNAIKVHILNDPKKRELLIEANKMDLALYRFVTEEFYPEQQRQHGKMLDNEVAAFQRENHVSLLDLRLVSNLFKRHMLYKPILFCYQHYRGA